MNVVVEDAGTCRKKLTIECPSERIEADYGRLLSEYAKAARIKGFRPGKAPLKLVEKQYAKHILEELRDRLVPEGYQQAIKEKAVKVVTVLDVDDAQIVLGSPLTFSVSVEVAPEFDLPEYKGIALERKKEEIPADKVDETINGIRDQFASFEAIEDRAVQKGDLVQVDYEGVCEGRPIEGLGDETKGLGARKDFWVRADENAFLPEFADGLAGVSIGGKKDIPVSFAEDFPVKALAGKHATYTVEVKAIREKKMPEMDAEFLKRLGVDDEAALRTHIETDLKRSAEQREERRLRSELIAHLLKSIDMDVPPTRVSRETQQIIRDIVQENSERGAKENQLMDKKDEIVEVATKGATDRVKVQFILDRIAELESITVAPQQLREHIDRMAYGYGMKPDAFRAELKKREATEGVEDELRRSLTIDYLMAQAVIKE